MTDHDLLQAYARQGSSAQAAFAELVARHLNLVYSAALRQVRATALAEDIAQSVFLDLARHARDFRSDQPLAAWLHVVTRRTAIDAIRRESRRTAREHTAASLAHAEFPASPDMPPSSDSPWSDLEPHLDEAVAALPAPDRQAILLRYFENKSLREIGESLGTSDDAAQKRVSRALDQLRTLLLRRGLTVTAAGLATDLSAHAIVTAPTALTGVIATSTAALSVATAVTSTAASSSAKAILMTTLQKSLVTAALVLTAGAGLYQAQLLSGHAVEIRAAQQRHEHALAAERDLRTALATTSARLKDVEQRIDARLTALRAAPPEDAALEAQMRQWLGHVDRMKDFLAQHPQWDSPELKLLGEHHWFNAASTLPLDTEEQFRRATAQLRDRAGSVASHRISQALNAYVLAQGGRLPDDPLQLAPYCDPPLDPAVLGRYEMLHTGPVSAVPTGQTMRILAPKAPADVEFDANRFIGTEGYGNNGVAMFTNLRDAQRKFSQAHEGRRATTADELLPYLKWPVSAAALEKHLNPPLASKAP